MKIGTIDTEKEITKNLLGDKVIWVIVFLLSLSSIALIYSASSSLAFKENTTNFSYLIKQIVFVVGGLGALFACYITPIGIYRALSKPLLYLSIILLVLTPIIGHEINGARRWISIFGITFQPTEIAKIAVVLYLARVLETSKLETYKEFLIKVVAPIGLVCVLILIGSVSSALFVGLISFLVLLIGNVKFNYIAKTAGIAVVAGIFMICLHLIFGIFPRLDTATNRLKKFAKEEEISHELTPEEKQKIADKTFQADMAKIAISSVKIFGKGPGKSTQRYVLPHPYSDYIYTIIIEEYGLFGGAFILMMYLWFLYSCVKLVKHCTKVFTAITVGGLGLLITTQAMLHILVNVGYLPVTGHTLPLLSLGGTSLIILSSAFGIILSVSRTIDITSMKNKQAQEKLEEKERSNNEEEELHEIMDTNGEFK